MEVMMVLTVLVVMAFIMPKERLFLQLNRLPYSVFSAVIMILCVIGAFGLSNSVDDLYVMFAFGVIGYGMRKFGFPIAPAVLGLVLGDLAELSLRRSLLLSLGNPLILISRPLSAILLIFAAVSILYPLFKKPTVLKDVEM